MSVAPYIDQFMRQLAIYNMLPVLDGGFSPQVLNQLSYIPDKYALHQFVENAGIFGQFIKKCRTTGEAVRLLDRRSGMGRDEWGPKIQRDIDLMRIESFNGDANKLYAQFLKHQDNFTRATGIVKTWQSRELWSSVEPYPETPIDSGALHS